MTAFGRAGIQVRALRFMFDPRYRADPYPLYANLRPAAPVLHSAMGATLLTRYDDVITALAEPRLSSVERHTDFSYRAGAEGAGRIVEAPFRFALHRAGVGVARNEPPTPFRRLARLLLISMDPPDHTRLRGLVARAFTPRVIQRARDDIQALAHELIDELEPNGRAELLVDYAYQFPVRVICRRARTTASPASDPRSTAPDGDPPSSFADCANSRWRGRRRQRSDDASLVGPACQLVPAGQLELAQHR